MNPKFAIGNDFHFEVDADEIGLLDMKGKIVSNNGDIAVIQIHHMDVELDCLEFTREELNEIVSDFDDQYVNKELPHEWYAIIDAETGRFRYQHNIDTYEIEAI